MSDHLKSGTKQWIARQRRHRHNSYSGFVAMMRQQLNVIIESDTTTFTAKAYARQMHAQSDYLARALKERVDAK